MSVDRLAIFPWLLGPREVSEIPKSFVSLTKWELQVQKYRAGGPSAKCMALKNKLISLSLPCFLPGILGVNLAAASSSLQVPSTPSVTVASSKAVVKLVNSTPYLNQAVSWDAILVQSVWGTCPRRMQKSVGLLPQSLLNINTDLYFNVPCWAVFRESKPSAIKY